MQMKKIDNLLKINFKLKNNKIKKFIKDDIYNI